MKKVSLNICVLFFWTYVFISAGYITRVEILTFHHITASEYIPNRKCTKVLK